MPEDERLHIAVQFLAVAFVIFAIHQNRLRRLTAVRPVSCSRSILPDEARKP